MTDDNEIDVMIASRVYKRTNLQNPFITFKSGYELLEYLKGVKRGENPLPAAVLLDINMPRMNGFEVLSTIRSDDAFKKIPIIIMLTNSDNKSDRSHSFDLGADGFQTKPYDLDQYERFFNSIASA